MQWPRVPLMTAAGSTGFITDGDWVTADNMDPDGGIRLVQLADIGIGRFLNRSSKFINEETFVQLGCTQLEGGDVLISRMADPIGRACLVPSFGQRAITAVDVTILRTDQSVADPRFIMYLCNHSEFRYLAQNAATGTTRSRITRRNLERIRIPLPPLSEQRRIVRILNQAMASAISAAKPIPKLIASCPALFLTMFGDPTTNPMRWPIKRFDTVCESRLGKMLDAKQQTGTHLRPYLRNANVYWDRLVLDELREMDFDEADQREFRLQPGDVLICEGGEVGRAAVWNDEIPDCYFQKALHRARPFPDVAVSEFVVYLLWELAKRGALQSASSKVTFSHLTGVKLKALRVPLPPFSLQQAFADKVRLVKRLAKNRDSALRLDTLFTALLDRAFSGALTASWRQDDTKEQAFTKMQQPTVLDEP